MVYSCADYGFELSFIIHFKFMSLCSDRVLKAGGSISSGFLTLSMCKHQCDVKVVLHSISVIEK